MADYVAPLVAGLGLQKPAICGWSDGGQIGLELAMRYLDLASVYIVGGAAKVFSESYIQGLSG